MGLASIAGLDPWPLTPRELEAAATARMRYDSARLARIQAHEANLHAPRDSPLNAWTAADFCPYLRADALAELHDQPEAADVDAARSYFDAWCQTILNKAR